MSQPVTTQPVRVRPHFSEAIWGGRRLADRFVKSLPEGLTIGESWEIFGKNLIENGPDAGRTLDELARQDPPGILGSRPLQNRDSTDQFPLLIKLIDACQPLSVQVHPDDILAYVEEAGSLGKTEAWHILESVDDSPLIYGLRDGVDRQRIAASVAAGTLHQDLSYLVTRPGDTVYVPAGTVHAIPAGTILYEVQQRSEVTYRLYDWGRVGTDGRPRQLHVAKALHAIRFPQPTPRVNPALTIAEPAGRRIFLAACRYFLLEALEGTIAVPADPTTFSALSVVAGTARLQAGGADENLQLGESVVLPARFGAYQISVEPGGRILRARVPDLVTDVIAPLRAAGYAESEISLLGEVL
ncbi:MAG TPA: type I phosphomannose isomerase catalytic subunit [Chloroflexota bacterium]|nr:type I phosphomannose isomerase catalytic subunit [Chloroflexota bacterium]